MKNRIPKPVQRLIEKAGQDFTAYSCRVTNPHITARESIVIGDYIVELQAELAKVTSERDKLEQAQSELTKFKKDSSAVMYEQHRINQAYEGAGR